MKPMSRFIREQNIRRYERLLATETDERQRGLIERLLTDEREALAHEHKRLDPRT